MSQKDQTWCPAIEFNETEKELILKAEIPGVEIKHLNINAEPESVSISGIHDHRKSSEETELIPSQLHYGTLDCNVPLPKPIQVDRVRAELIDGVLTITMPKVNVASKAGV
ncbi:Hsp20/alpha crystallin family protein [Pleurocapsales cyanobacterium LEGE 10410]|nr:Hsp20/alpha crystallin family protein [Pleurocapsales cyanobacterium LEGE 10410]